MPEAAVVIVGGGAAGLSAAGALGRVKIPAVVLEQDPQIGDVWARRYGRLRLHTVRQFSGLAHFPIPLRYPRYLSGAEYATYLQEYAQQLGLLVINPIAVTRVRAPRDGASPWMIDIDTPGGEAWQAQTVVIATGQYRQPILPAWPGLDTFGGHFTHSIGYRTPTPYAGKRVLVVGSGNSGAEIATDLSEHGAAMVAISIRTAPPIVPRDPFGMPVQRTSMLLSALPPAIADRLGWLTARLALGDLTRYGMPKGRFAPYRTQHVPLIDVGFVDALKHKRVTLRPAVAGISSTGAIFADGSAEAFDAIIAATGFSTSLASLLDLPDGDGRSLHTVLDEFGEPRGRHGDPTAFPGLYFLGFTHSLRGHLFEANRASRRLARHLRAHFATR